MKKRQRNVFRYLVTAGLLLALGYLADLGKIFRHIVQADIFLYLAGTQVFLSIYFWSAFRWNSLIKGLGYSMSLGESLKVISMSYGFNKILPLNSGDLTRSKLMERYTEIDSHGKVLGAVAMERLLDIIFLGVLTGISSFYVLGSNQTVNWILPGVTLILLLMISLRVHGDFYRRITDLVRSFGVSQSVTGFLKNGLEGYSEISASDLLEVCIWHSLRWTAGILVIYILALSLGSPISVAGAVLATGVMNLVAALPITPAGLGPVEAAGTGILVIIGLSASQAAALVVLQRSLGFVLMGGIGAIVYSLDK